MDWQRIPIEGDTLRKLTRKSDLKGLTQTLSYFAILAVTFAAAYLAGRAMADGRFPIWAAALVFFLLGTCWAFLLNGFNICVTRPNTSVCRTFTLNPVVRFLYWHMNYHTEHHMYAAVPCYNLGKLHRALRHALPPWPKSIYRTWKQIAAIQRKQKAAPGYQFAPELPE